MVKSNITQLVDSCAQKTASKSQTSTQSASSTSVSSNVPSSHISSETNTHPQSRAGFRPITTSDQINQNEQLGHQNGHPTHSEVLRSNENQESMQVEEPLSGSRGLNTENQGLEEEAKGNDGSASNGPQASRGTGRRTLPNSNISSTLHAAMLACLKVNKADIEWKFFNNKECKLCGKSIKKKLKGHIKYHIEEKPHIKCNYSICLQADGKDLEIKCKNCSQKFSKPTAQDLKGHSQACNPNGINLNNRTVISMNENDYEKLEKMCMEEINALKKTVATLETKLGKTDKKLAGVFRTQKSEKKRLDTTEKRVGKVEENVKTVEEKVGNQENVLVGLLNHLIDQGHFERPREAVTSSNIFDRLVRRPTREQERDRERSRERTRRGSQERMVTRQSTRDQRDSTRDRERPEQRRTTREEDYSRERSRDTRETGRHHAGGSYRRPNRR